MQQLTSFHFCLNIQHKILTNLFLWLAWFDSGKAGEKKGTLAVGNVRMGERPYRWFELLVMAIAMIWTAVGGGAVGREGVAGWEIRAITIATSAPKYNNNKMIMHLLNVLFRCYYTIIALFRITISYCSLYIHRENVCSLNATNTLVSVKNTVYDNKHHINSSYEFILTSVVVLLLSVTKRKLYWIRMTLTNNTKQTTYLLPSMTYVAGNLITPYNAMLGIRVRSLGIFLSAEGQGPRFETNYRSSLQRQSNFFNCLTYEDGTDSFPQNLGTKLIFDAA